MAALPTSPTARQGTWWPLLAAGLVLAVSIAVLQQRVIARNGGTFSYAVDDAYIHMAIARHVVQDHTWGISGHEFSLASSSPLWTGLLAAGFAIIGIVDSLPFVMNCALLVPALWLASRALAVAGVFGIRHLFALLAFIYLTPLPALVFSGMEHILHTVLSLAYLCVLLELLVDARVTQGMGRLLAWGLLSFLLPVARYEGLFFIAVACTLLLLRKAWLPLLVTAICASASVTAVGLWSLANGGLFLPNSILLKGKTGLLYAQSLSDLATWAGTGLLAPFKTPHVLVLMSAMLILLVAGAREHVFWSKRQLGLLIVPLVLALHMAFGATGSFFRYEAYLVALSIVVMAGAALPRARLDQMPSRWPALVYAGVGVYLALPLLVRGGDALVRIPQACGNIYQQQLQMAAFVREYYNDAAVALNDVGAVGYRSNARILDLMGLGSNGVARLRRARRFTTAGIAEWTARADVTIAIVYDKTFSGIRSPPQTWVRVATWTIPDRYVCFDDTVTFYAVRPGEADRLRGVLKAFSSKLPPTVTVRFCGDPS